MWVFIRPRGGQDCYLLTCEIRVCPEFCPIHRFDGMDQIPMARYGTLSPRNKYNRDRVDTSQKDMRKKDRQTI